MLGTVPAQFRELVREEARNSQHQERKRRRRNNRKQARKEKHKVSTNTEVSESDERQKEGQEVIILDDELAQQLIDQEKSKSRIENEEEEEEDIDDEQFEEIDLNFQDFGDEVDPAEEMVLTYDKEPQESKSKKGKTRRVNMVSAEERKFRRDFHLLYLIVMACYGRLRNAWCNDTSLQRFLRLSLPQKLTDEYKIVKQNWSDSKVTVSLKTRKFLDFLRHLMWYWNSSYRITNSFMYQKRNWGELSKEFSHEEVSREKFKYLIRSHMGSSEICLEGFVMLLRSLGLYTRLVISLQPPDFTNVAAVDFSVSEEKKSSSPSVPKTKKVTKDDYLSLVRSGKPRSQSKSPGPINQEAPEYPVMWAEVWDKYSQKWISIDPVVQKTIDIVGRKSKFEPPLNNKKNNCFYVIGYDQRNAVRDITRRYASNLNSKVRRKRVTRDPRYALWWERVLRELNTPRTRHASKIDALERVEFEERDLREGMPDSFEDFRNHPVYCLESQLKQNEILYPKQSCGTVRKKSSNEVTPVYKRLNVHTVRSPKAWYLKGRMIKLGERCLATKDAPKTADDDEDETRLYAEFQTELYIPPPIENGIVPKNAYGNIDVYVKTMLPKNGAHITGKRAIKAAKLLGIDFAPAVVGFDFGGNNKGVANARIDGIVVAKEFEEAMSLTCQCLQEMHEEEELMRKNIRLLKCWKIFLTKLRIKDRLNKTHGKLEETDETYEQGGFVASDRVFDTDKQDSKSTQDWDNYSDSSSNYVPSESSGNETDYGIGGFIPSDDVSDLGNVNERETKLGGSTSYENEFDESGHSEVAQAGLTPRSGSELVDKNQDSLEGGFVKEDQQSAEEGGFLLEDAESGGFLPEDAELDKAISEEIKKAKFPVETDTLSGQFVGDEEIIKQGEFSGEQDFDIGHFQNLRDEERQGPQTHTSEELSNDEIMRSEGRCGGSSVSYATEVAESRDGDGNQETNLTEEAMVTNIAKFQEEQQQKPVENNSTPIVIDSADEPEIATGQHLDEFDFEYSDSE
ncbi:DNA repair protein [Komagataella phaffii CBS 7435]|uniref:DNA repair protein n=2 Tax=Komagataella phaffii TaxID=460519 RepID=C4QVV6_KOMPG|nr:DNA repair protein [Komagataella phaffii GS115]CAH2446038.1 DNA repair protein [Komagataella phaffii CBS 7435]CAY67379.1 DNA repair protein [Komagataella phaffii GS115]CCA36478.1 DNA repair protein [Komagataella phaffii CBS 7435]